MKKAFSLLEVIVVISVILILVYFLSSKYTNIFSYTTFANAKTQYSMVKSSILEVKTKDILKGEGTLLSLDDAGVNIENEELFSKVLKAPILSQKKAWMKVSENKYVLNVENKKIYFEYKNGNFICVDTNNICKELE